MTKSELFVEVAEDIANLQGFMEKIFDNKKIDEISCNVLERLDNLLYDQLEDANIDHTQYKAHTIRKHEAYQICNNLLSIRYVDIFWSETQLLLHKCLNIFRG